MKNIFRDINKTLTEEDILMLSPLQLAYIGDGVYELFIRTYLLDGKKNVNQMNKQARKLVNAKAQADIVAMLEDFLTSKEKKVVKRGRNAKVHSSPKNMNIMDYKYATGFEALLGYLYLRGEDERLYTIMEKILYSEVLLRLKGVILKPASKEESFIKADLEKLFSSKSIDFEASTIENLGGEAGLETRLDFPLDFLDYSKQEEEIKRVFNDYLEEEGLVFQGDWLFEFKGEKNEG